MGASGAYGRLCARDINQPNIQEAHAPCTQEDRPSTLPCVVWSSRMVGRLKILIPAASLPPGKPPAGGKADMLLLSGMKAWLSTPVVRAVSFGAIVMPLMERPDGKVPSRLAAKLLFARRETRSNIVSK